MSEFVPLVTITSDEYDDLKDSKEFLDCLYAAGLDNWEGYSFAVAKHHRENWEDNNTER